MTFVGHHTSMGDPKHASVIYHLSPALSDPPSMLMPPLPFLLTANPNSMQNATFPSLIFMSQQLSLKSNPSLTGKMPDKTFFFKSLQVLTLSQNDLFGGISDSITSVNIWRALPLPGKI
jgi:hypothetical protein